MIAATRGLSQDRILRTAQIVMMFLASIVVVAFMRFHLLTAAKTFRQDFERQSFVELSRGETFLLARKLAALGKSEQFSCISAKKSGILFFEETNGSCDSGFFRSREIVVEPNHELEIAFTMQLSGELYLGLLLFLTAQGALAAIVVLSQRRLNFLQYESELA